MAEFDTQDDGDFIELEKGGSDKQAPQLTAEQIRIKELEDENKSQKALFEKLAGRPVEVKIDREPAPAPRQAEGDPYAQLKDYVNKNMLSNPGDTLVNVLLGVRQALEETYVKPQQLERAH